MFVPRVFKYNLAKTNWQVYLKYTRDNILCKRHLSCCKESNGAFLMTYKIFPKTFQRTDDPIIVY